MLDKPLISERVETPELERASKAYISLKFKKMEEKTTRAIRDQRNPFYHIKGPIRVRYIKYNVEKTPGETLRYHVIMRISVTMTSNAKGDTEKEVSYYTVIATRKPMIAPDGTISYNNQEFDTFRWGVSFDDMKARNKLATLEKEYFR